jgi:hypothetical protein
MCLLYILNMRQTLQSWLRKQSEQGVMKNVKGIIMNKEISELAMAHGFKRKPRTVVWSGKTKDLAALIESVRRETAEQCAAMADPVAPWGVADLIRHVYDLNKEVA